jgi:hypothetical protein
MITKGPRVEQQVIDIRPNLFGVDALSGRSKGTRPARTMENRHINAKTAGRQSLDVP